MARNADKVPSSKGRDRVGPNAKRGPIARAFIAITRRLSRFIGSEGHRAGMRDPDPGH